MVNGNPDPTLFSGKVTTSQLPKLLAGIASAAVLSGGGVFGAAHQVLIEPRDARIADLMAQRDAQKLTCVELIDKTRDDCRSAAEKHQEIFNVILGTCHGRGQ